MRGYREKLHAGGPELEEQIFLQFIEGKTSVKRLCRDIGVSIRALYDWLQEDPERWVQWQKAKELRAEVMAEDTLDLADDVDESKEAIAKAETQIKVRQWLAACNFPARYGKNAKVEVSINQLHLEAVRDINAEDTQRRLAAAAAKETVITQPEFAVEASDATLEDLLA